MRGRPETNRIECSHIPTAANVDEWLAYIGRQVGIASGRSDDLAAQWIWAIARVKNFSALRYVDERMRRLDKVLFAAIEGAVRKAGKDKPLYKRLLADLSNAMSEGYSTKGQQAVYRALEAVRTNELLGSVYSVELVSE